jgi:hypothetical protein
MTRSKCTCGERCSEAVDREHEHGKRMVDHNLRFA